MLGKLFLIAAPCGGGKTSLIQAVLEYPSLKQPVQRVITYTSRAPRCNEQNGKEYHFISHTEFEHCRQNDFFLESSNAYGAYYGSPRSLITHINAGQNYIMAVDRAGAQEIALQIKGAVLIWVNSPEGIWQQRLVGRNSETSEQIALRIEQSRRELEHEKAHPFFHHYIINDQFYPAFQQLLQVIQGYL